MLAVTLLLSAAVPVVEIKVDPDQSPVKDLTTLRAGAGFGFNCDLGEGVHANADWYYNTHRDETARAFSESGTELVRMNQAVVRYQGDRADRVAFAKRWARFDWGRAALDMTKWRSWTPQKNIDPAVIWILVAAGADPGLADENRTTALMIAAGLYPPRPDLIEALVLGGADLNATDGIGHTVLHRLALLGGNGSDEAARKLIQLGAKVNLRDNNGKTPLMLARQYNKRLIKPLLDAGAE